MLRNSEPVLTSIFRHLWEMFHILGMNVALALIGGQVSIIFSDLDFIRNDVHSCAAVGGAINYFYIGCSALVFTKAHAIFKAFTEGVIGGRTKTYLCIGWGIPFLGKLLNRFHTFSLGGITLYDT